jgi:hypothetical protein
MNDFEKKQASQNKPASEAVSTESLKAMSPAELADALELALDSMTEENYDPDLIDAYLDALDQKAPMPEEPQVEEAFKAFKSRLSVIPFENKTAAQEHDSGHRARPRPFKRAIVTIAATVSILFVLMIGAQAAGIDVFGNLARWTDEVFFFIPSSSETYTSEFSAALQEALERAELPKELAPTWFPEGFTAEEPEFWDDDVSTAVGISFVNPEGKSFIVSIDFYKEAGAIETLPFEKDAGNVEVYISKNRTFYIMSNINVHFAVWTDGNLLESIRGDLSVDQIKAMIDSIGG